MSIIQLDVRHLQCYNYNFYTLKDLIIDPNTWHLYCCMGRSRLIISISNPYTELYHSKVVIFRGQHYLCNVMKTKNQLGSFDVNTTFYVI